MRLKLIFSVFFPLVFLMIGCKTRNDRSAVTSINSNKDLIKGFNFTGTSYKLKDYSTFSEMKHLGSNWLSFSPFCYMKSGNKGALRDSFPGQWIGESFSGVSAYIDSAKSRKLKVLVNPHIWIVDGTFTGDLSLSRLERERWQKDYSVYLLKWARICEDKNVEMFSIGNELKTPVLQDKVYWKNLISEVRKVYSGKITYASNWDNIERISFWDDLDVISVNAYFPLSEVKNPSEIEVKDGWKKWSEKLEGLKHEYNKPLIFTELGYLSQDYCCARPWDYSKRQSNNEECQAKAFEVFFKEVLGKSCNGVFIWKWYDKNDTHEHDSYSPQGKKAIETIKAGFRNG